MITSRPAAHFYPLPSVADATEALVERAVLALPKILPFRSLGLAETIHLHGARWSEVLSHELSDALVSRAGWSSEAPLSSPNEFVSLRRLSGSTSKLDMSALARLNALLTGFNGGFRNADAFIGGDPFLAIQLCDAETAAKKTKALLEREHPETPRNAFVAAVQELVCLNNYHPFRDGNGRTARVLFNLRMHTLGLPSDAYLPLKELFWTARGGYQICLRMAEIRGEWDPIVEIFARIVGIAANWPRGVEICET